MKIANKTVNEDERIQDLNSYSILDTIPERDFDHITRLASYICDTDISLVSLIDKDRQWFKSKVGLDVSETKRDFSFCAHAINTPNEIFIVPDSRKDERFFDNPLVTSSPNVIFYAGVVLVSRAGNPLGTLCVIDNKPKELNQSQISSLEALSKQVLNVLELRKQDRVNKLMMSKLNNQNIALEQFAIIAAHDIKSPLNNIIGLTDLLKENVNEKEIPFVENISNSAITLKKLVNSILEYSTSETTTIEKNALPHSIQFIQKKLVELFDFKYKFDFQITSNQKDIFIDEALLFRILSNLLWNSIRYSNKDVPLIRLNIEIQDDSTRFIFVDNGPGINESLSNNIFQIFKTGNSVDRFGNQSVGVGLATIKKMLDEINGSISLDLTYKKGAKFIFNIPN